MKKLQEMEIIKEHFSMIMIGKRRSGKSTLIRELFINKLKNRYDHVIVFSDTAREEKGFWGEFIPGDLMFPYDPIRLDMAFKLNEIRASKNKPMISFLFIWDDCVSEKQKSDNSIMQAFTRGRHSGISIIFTTQSKALVNKKWRENSDYVCLFRDNNIKNREDLIDDFLLGTIPSQLSTNFSDSSEKYDEMTKKMRIDFYNELFSSLEKGKFIFVNDIKSECRVIEY